MGNLRTEGLYSCSFKPNERCIGRYKPFFLDPHLLECQVIEDSCHLWNETRQLDVLNHPQVSLTCFFGRIRSCGAPYNHPYVSQGWPRALIIPSCSLLLWWVYPFLTDESLQFSLSDQDFNFLLQVIAFSCVVTVIPMKTTILVSGPLVGISPQLATQSQGCIVLDLQ